jgi:peroxiredoxin
VQLDKEFQGRNVDIIGIALSEHVVMAEKDKTKLRQWCQEHGVSYPQAASTARILEDYGDIHEVPVTVLMDAQGHIRYRWDGERDYATFRPAIERLLNESTKP